MQQPNQKLGMGLSALLRTPDATTEPVSSVDQNGVSWVNPAQMIPCPDQPRKYFGREEIQQLADSIKKNGVLQPILVRSHAQGQWEIIAGERRWRAAQLAGLSTVPVIVKNLSDAEVLVVALVENIQREDLSPLEEAESYQKMITSLSYTQEKIAELVGKSRSYIANTVRLLSLPPVIKTALQEKKISAAHARALVGLNEDKAQEWLEKIITQQLNARDLERMRSQALRPDAPVGFGGGAGEVSAVAQDLHHMENMLSEALGMPTSIILTKNGGKIQLSFYQLEDLDKLLERFNVRPALNVWTVPHAE